MLSISFRPEVLHLYWIAVRIFLPSLTVANSVSFFVSLDFSFWVKFLWFHGFHFWIKSVLIETSKFFDVGASLGKNVSLYTSRIMRYCQHRPMTLSLRGKQKPRLYWNVFGRAVFTFYMTSQKTTSVYADRVFALFRLMQTYTAVRPIPMKHRWHATKSRRPHMFCPQITLYKRK